MDENRPAVGAAGVMAKGYFTHVREHPELIESDIRLIEVGVARGARLLDIGAGRGSFVQVAVHRGFDTLALEMQTEASSMWTQAGLPGVIGDGSRAPFVDACFDVVRMKEVIEHVDQPLSLVREARRLLRPGGIVLAHVPSSYSQLYPVGNFWDDYTHVRPFSRTGLQRLFDDAGFQGSSIEGYVAGRNAVERVAGMLLAHVLPHTYRVVARK